MNRSKNNNPEKVNPSQNKAGKRSKRNKKKRAARRLEDAQARGIVGGQESVRGREYLQLNRDQYSATTPLTLWEIRQASTPGGMRVRGREMMATMLAPAAVSTFQLLGWNVTGQTSLPLNPLSFPRLTSIAKCYEQYLFHGAKIWFQSQLPTTSAGMNFLSVEYDPKDQAPTTASQLLANVSSACANVYSDMSTVVIKEFSRVPRYFVQQSVSGDSAQVYQASLYAGTQGYAPTAGQSMGLLIVEYDVEFYVPQLAS